jgi:acyl-coenzyme A thioesterase PaaI-like protein
MLDSCRASRFDADKGIGSTTLEFKISFVWPITPKTGLIKAEGMVDQLGPPVGTAEGQVTDSKGRLLDLTGRTCFPEYCWSRFRACPWQSIHLRWCI